MTIYVLAEGPSERAFLEKWVPRLGLNHCVNIHPHQGKGSLPSDFAVAPPRYKRGLLDQLPAKLRGFADALEPSTDSIVVLVDADSDDVLELKKEILAVARDCCPTLNVHVCIAQEETEAFYLGDLAALENAYPKCDMEKARRYVPDSVCGTWELFGTIVDDDGGNKVAWGTQMGRYVTVVGGRSRSASFNALLTGIRALDTLPTHVAKPKRKYRHAAK